MGPVFRLASQHRLNIYSPRFFFEANLNDVGQQSHLCFLCEVQFPSKGLGEGLRGLCLSCRLIVSSV